jgi:hypothetical protein
VTPTRDDEESAELDELVIEVVFQGGLNAVVNLDTLFGGFRCPEILTRWFCSGIEDKHSRIFITAKLVAV